MMTHLKSPSMNDPKQPSGTQDSLVTIQTFEGGSDLQLIHGYGDNGFRITGARLSGSVFVLPRITQSWTPPADCSQLTAAHITALFDDPHPPLFILGVGGAPMEPLLDLATQLRSIGIALEVMSTPAACRTWNVLMSEGRFAGAGLYAIA